MKKSRYRGGTQSPGWRPTQWQQPARRASPQPPARFHSDPAPRHLRLERAKHIHGALQIGQLLALDPRQFQQAIAVDDLRDVAIVGDPVQDNGIIRCRKLARQAQIEVVLGLKKLVSGSIDFGTLVF